MRIFSYQRSAPTACLRLKGKVCDMVSDMVKMIRHVLTHTVSFSGAPDFSSSFFGYYGSYSYTDPQGQTQTRKYSMFPNALYGVPGQGRSGTVSVSLANNLEMKVKSDNDSIGEKKISLIENFSVSQSYNFAADSLNWSNINTSLLLRRRKSRSSRISAYPRATTSPPTRSTGATSTPRCC